ncbi:phasin family protein [Pseudosulfitobacter sp. SM2401]|uniref:phasin family protein n=1 Tax=Pseudosulfitobacter sp. SM2401 TaxID=3350098 RepID=UPI0036F221D2
MANKPQPQDPIAATSKDTQDKLTQLQSAGFGNLMGMSTAWLEAVGDMSAEVVGFVAERIKEDVKTQHEILQCRNVADLQHVQAQFFQKAMDQYRVETGKLVEMTSSKASVAGGDGTGGDGKG